jgi:predicted transcriptional regulator
LTWCRNDGMSDGMKAMAHRITFALDQETAGRLRRLSAAWQVSPTEVIRRALAMAETTAPMSEDAASLLRELHDSGGGLVRESAESYLSAARADRQQWRRAP